MITILAYPEPGPAYRGSRDHVIRRRTVAARVELGPESGKIAEPRISRAQVLGIPGVHLAPVRPAAGCRQHGLHVAEILRMRRGMEDMKGDIRGVPAVRRGQPDIVAR